MYTGPNLTGDSRCVLRLDAGNVKSFPGEPTTNNIKESEDISNGVWEKQGNIPLTYDSNIQAPDGSKGAYLLTYTTAGQYLYQIVNLTAGTYTLSVWVKGTGVPHQFSQAMYNGSSYDGGVIHTTTSEWHRFSSQITFSTGISSGWYPVAFYPDNGTPGSMYVWGAQLEAKPYATAYLPTTSAAVTRGTTVATGGGWKDLSGNNNDGELVNGPVYNSDQLGSIVFDGTNDRIPTSNTIGTLSAYSIMFWMCRTADTTSFPISVTDVTDGYFYWYGDSSWCYTHGGTGGEYYYSHNATIPLGTWGFYCVTYDGSYVKIYRNNVCEGSVLSTGAAVFSKIQIGALTYGAYLFAGKIANIQMFSRAFSASEVLQNYNALKFRYLERIVTD